MVWDREWYRKSIVVISKSADHTSYYTFHQISKPYFWEQIQYTQPPHCTIAVKFTIARAVCDWSLHNLSGANVLLTNSITLTATSSKFRCKDALSFRNKLTTAERVDRQNEGRVNWGVLMAASWSSCHAPRLSSVSCWWGSWCSPELKNMKLYD